MTEKKDHDVVLYVSHLRKWFDIQSGLRKSKGKVKAVDDVSFSLNRGETLGIVGETGCGKTTLGRTILRLIDPTSGEVYFDLPKAIMQEVMEKEKRLDQLLQEEEEKSHDQLSQDDGSSNSTDSEKAKLEKELEGLRNKYSLSRLSKRSLLPYRKRMQPVFQDPFSSLNPRMLVRDIIAEPMQLLTASNDVEIQKKTKDLMDEMGLSEDHLYRFPHEFSGGQRQRIGLARAISIEPDLLVLDEPTSALDVSVQAQILNMLRDVQARRDLSFLFISHHLSVIRMVSDRVAVMYLGRIVELAKTDKLFTEMLHPYTKTLLSAIPVPDPDTRRERIILEGEIPSPSNPPKGCHFHTRCHVAMKNCGWSPVDLAEPIRTMLDKYRNPEAIDFPDVEEIVVNDDAGVLDVTLVSVMNDKTQVSDLLNQIIDKEKGRKGGIMFSAIESIDFLDDNRTIRIKMGDFDIPVLREVRDGHFVSCLIYDLPQEEPERVERTKKISATTPEKS